MTVHEVSMALPPGYAVERVMTTKGPMFRAIGPSYKSPLVEAPRTAEHVAVLHYYQTAFVLKPHLRVTKYGVSDMLTGHVARHDDVRKAGSYGAAYRLRAESMRVTADTCRYEKLADLMWTLADELESVANRIEGVTDVVESSDASR